MKKYQSFWCYVPIILSLALGFLVGGYLAFGTKFLNLFPSLKNETGRLVLILFGMGVLGATTYSARFWARDVNNVVYEDKDFLPHIYDFFGYITTIVGGGITGVILYLVTRTGIGIATTDNIFPQLNLSSAVLIAYCGGLFHFRVQRMLSQVVDKILKEKRQKVPGKSKPNEAAKSTENNNGDLDIS